MGDTFILGSTAPDASSVPAGVSGPAPGSDLLVAATRELSEYHAANQKFSGMDPDEVLVMISAITARLTYLRSCLSDTGSQRARKILSSNLDPLMSNLDLQFRIASRRLTARQFDFEVTRGAPT